MSADSTTQAVLAALRDHMTEEPPSPEAGSGPFEFYERAERARLAWERTRDAYHTILAARLLRAFLDANEVTR
jgi:hypothetical protein